MTILNGFEWCYLLLTGGDCRWVGTGDGLGEPVGGIGAIKIGINFNIRQHPSTSVNIAGMSPAMTIGIPIGIRAGHAAGRSLGQGALLGMVVLQALKVFPAPLGPDAIAPGALGNPLGNFWA